MEYELIVVSLISIAGMIITTQLWQLNWFKKENFKIHKSNVMGENRIKLKKLEREIGLKGTKLDMPETPSTLGTLASLAPLLKNLDADQLGLLIDKFTGGELPETEEGGALGFLDNLPPELVEKGIAAITKGAKTEDKPNYL